VGSHLRAKKGENGLVELNILLPFVSVAAPPPRCSSSRSNLHSSGRRELPVRVHATIRDSIGPQRQEKEGKVKELTSSPPSPSPLSATTSRRPATSPVAPALPRRCSQSLQISFRGTAKLLRIRRERRRGRKQVDGGVDLSKFPPTASTSAFAR